MAEQPSRKRPITRRGSIAVLAAIGAFAVLWLPRPSGDPRLIGDWIVHYPDLDVEITLGRGGNGTMEPLSINGPMKWWFEEDRLYFEMLDIQLTDRLLAVLRQIGGEQRELSGGWRVVEIRADVVLLQGDGTDFHMTRKPPQSSISPDGQLRTVSD